MNAWGQHVLILNGMAEQMRELARDFNVDKRTCSCGESRRYIDLKQWQVRERYLGLASRLETLAKEVERNYPQFIAKSPAAPLPPEPPKVFTRDEHAKQNGPFD